MRPAISIIIPAFNEEKNIIPLFKKILSVIPTIRKIGNCEIIFVDDGSTDGTFKEIISIKDPYVKTVHLQSRMGKSLALKAGFDLAQGEILLTMDADLQDEPAEIPLFLNKIQEGYDVVIGRRKFRKDNITRKISSRVANGIRRLVLGDSFNDIGCGLQAYRKKNVPRIVFFEGIHRFLPILFLPRGGRYFEVEVRHHQRFSGKSKYNIRNRLFRTIRDLIRIKIFLLKRG